MSTENAVKELDKRFNRLVSTSASTLCTRCGWCADSCHVYLGSGDPAMTPVAKAERVRRVYKKHHDWLSRILPFWTGARRLDQAELDSWTEMAYRNCTLCERCLVNCPMAVETGAIMGAARGMLTAVDRAPEMLVQLAESAISKEENIDLYREFFLEQVSELETQVQQRLGDPNASIPLEKEGARFLFVPLAGAHTIVPPAVIFNAVKESWTMSMFEASNYAVFVADVARAKQITGRLVREAQRLKVEEVIVSECGHAYTTLRWEAPKWFGGELPFRVRSILEVIDEYVSQGRLKLDPSRHPQAMTYHDSCNLGRKGGLYEEPRRVLGTLAGDVREMTPNRLQNFCCGGGAGLVAMLEWEDFRIQSGKPKAEQIRDTGASLVVTSCDNCRHQIVELGEHYDLGIAVSSLSELVADSLVTEGAAAAAAKTEA